MCTQPVGLPQQFEVLCTLGNGAVRDAPGQLRSTLGVHMERCSRGRPPVPNVTNQQFPSQVIDEQHMRTDRTKACLCQDCVLHWMVVLPFCVSEASMSHSPLEW